MKFLMMCRARKLDPFEGDSFFIGFDTQDGPRFSLITAHQAFLKRAELNPEYDGMESGVIVIRDNAAIELEGDFHLDSDTLVGGWCRVYFKNRSKPMFKRVKLTTFNKGTQLWASNPSGMITKCAEADALRSSFPTLLGGLYLKEELPTENEAPRISTPMFKSDKAIEAPKVEPEVVDVNAMNLEHLQAMVERDGVDVKVLIELLQVSGLAGDGITGLSELAPDDVIKIIDNWDVLMEQIKKANG